MNGTKKLYDMDSYATDFEAVVISCEKIEDKEECVYQIVLDQTLFSPEEGGQSPDKGIINDIEVIDVQIIQGIIYHSTRKMLSPGTQVHGKIDWNHRFNNMQQHSGEHIFSGLVNKIYGYDNVGFHLSNQTVTMDFNGVLTLQQVEEIEQKVNEVIQSNLPIIVSYPTKEELKDLNYRSKIEIEGQVRIVTILDTDVCACCAPHVRSTGEIGFLKVMTLQNYKGGVRISILCGFRALYEFRKKNALLTEIASMFSTNQEALPMIIQKLKDTNQALKYELIEMKKDNLNHAIASIPNNQEDVILFEDGLDTIIMRNAVNELTKKHTGICGVFTKTEENGYQFILGSSTKDVKDVMAKLKEHLDVRGGGSPTMVQGSVLANKADIIHILS